MNAPKRSAVSKSWAPVRTHAGIYTGGKVQLNADGRLACMLQEDVAIVDAATGALQFVLQADIPDEQKESIVTFAWRPKHNQLVTASRNSLLRLWDLDTKSVIRTIKTADSPILCMDFDPSGTLVATGGSDRTVKVFDIEKGFCTHNFKKHSGIVTLVKFHWDPKQLLVASSSDDSTVRIWDLYAQKEVACIKDHMSPATTVAFSLDGYTLLSSGRDKVVNFWDLRKQQLLQTVLAHEAVTSLVVVPSTDGLEFVTAGEKGVLKHWRQASGSTKVVATQPAEAAKVSYVDLLFNAERSELVAVTSEHNLLVFTPALQRTRQIIGFNDDILSLKFVPSADGAGLSDHLVAATNSEQIRVMNRDTLSCELLSGHTDIVMALAVAPNGQYLVSASKDGTARVWDLATFACVAVGVAGAESLGAVAIAQKMHHYSPAGGAFFVTGSTDKTMKLWSLAPVQQRSGNGIATLSATAATKAHEKDVNAVAVAPNDRLVASGSQDKLIKIWNAQTLAPMGTCRGHKRGVWALEFSPVDQCLASASSDKTVKLWSLKDYSCLKTFEGHTASVLNVQFVCAGMQLVSAGADGLLKLWTIKTNECEATLDEHADKIWALAVAKDSSEMATGGADSTIHLWHDFTEAEEEKRQAEHDTKLLKEQELMNCLRGNDYLQAIAIAFEIAHPFRLMQILRDLKEGPKGKDVEGGDHMVFDPVIAALDDAKLGQLLEWLRDWNTNAKHAAVTQLLLSSLLRLVPPARWAGIPQAAKTLDGLIAFSERHFQRMERMLQKSYLVDFTIVSMQKLLPTVEADETSSKRQLEADAPAAKKAKV
ncbi:U3 small nucleolar RNA-associated protein [Achlya hypogyna]|uniref:U3 small nucleolar RNA-associated protein n=1 Tax=Achlya hypogyna TaxID=1202772 RepID=A0A1V9ZS57_ACHHY|nr:U3 small nucleolar RNA-associated protein [Achlya hypogyna]